MNKVWLSTCLLISFALLSVLKSYELRSLATFFRGEKVIKLKNFESARMNVEKEDLEHLKLWESILTGRAGPLSKVLKKRYATLGLNHIFTPSGFHLSAVLFPFMKILSKRSHQFIFLFFVGGGLLLLPGLLALKRMVLIKAHQRVMGLHAGFVIALLLDIFFGSFQEGALSFTYSFLFLGIIYSGAKGLSLIIWFFIGQIILAHFQGTDVPPLILIFSPLLNFSFGILMPVLFLLAIPLWDWQLHIGIFLVRSIQNVVGLFYEWVLLMPTLEAHFGLLLCVFLMLRRNFKATLICILLFSNSLNLDRNRRPGPSINEYNPKGDILRVSYGEKQNVVFFEDGNCRLKLVQGFWWESCSPRRRSSLIKY